MADRIKGITVEIGGDTTGLSKALSGVNKEIRNTQSQLTDVNRLLKLDPTNSELLSQKQKLLSQAVGETKEKAQGHLQFQLGTAEDQAAALFYFRQLLARPAVHPSFLCGLV
jgi:phage-related minor tail protein